MNDSVGNDGILVFSNSNYVVTVTAWSNPIGPKLQVGAAAYCKGDGTSVAAITANNALIGGTANDKVGKTTLLSNGTYLVLSPSWTNPMGPIATVGAVTLCKADGTTVGLVTSANSLTGSTAGDQDSNLANITSGFNNAAFGFNALPSTTTGDSNTAIGGRALSSNTTGSRNSAVGNAALQSCNGSDNIALGYGAGTNLTTGSGNIDIGNQGVAGESNVIRIGGGQTDTFLTGIIHGNGSGLTGVPGTVSAFADFYALMPADNATTVAVGSSVQFPQNGPVSNITRSSTSQFVLPNIGTYQVNFQVSVSEPGQLIVVLNGADLPYTVVGRATGTSQIVGTCLVTTSVINSVIEIRNPSGNSTALTITPLAGGTRAVSAHLVITQIK